MTPNTMPLSTLRNHPLSDELTRQLRMHSLLISPIPFLGIGGSGTLVQYKNLSGILTATHVMAQHLDTKEIFFSDKSNSGSYIFFQ